jgi:hypothetical protein
MKKPPDLLLVFPPFWDAGTPYLSVPTLAAYLQQHDVSVETADLNKICLNSLLTPAALVEAIDKAEQVLAGWTSRNGDTDYKNVFRENLRFCQRVWATAGESLVKDLHTPLPAGVDAYAYSNRNLRWVFRILNAPYSHLPKYLTGPIGTQEFDRLSTLAKAVENAEMPGAELIRSFALQQASQNIPVLGISVASPSQLPAALLLAQTFKTHSRDTFVCIGGPYIPYIVDALPYCRQPFDWVDAFVTGEGELPLVQICHTALTRGDMADIKGLHLRRDDGVVYTGEQGMVALDELPPPDFTNFEPETYLNNDGSLCLTFARGCSWSQCTFCTQFITFNGYRVMSAGKVAEHLEAVTRRYPLKTISLNDENVIPERLREIGAVIRRIAPSVRWMTLSRLSPQLADAALVRELADSGCVMLSLGLESADQNVLNLNRKGITVASMPAILQTLHQAGIWVHVFLILGLPGETRDSALRTIRFVHDHIDLIDSLSPTTFRLERHSAIWRHPHDFGIIPEAVPDDWCAEGIPFETEKWLGRSESLIFIEYLIQSLIGLRQCPIEQADLNGQYLMQLLERLGTVGVRAEMAKRAQMSAAAQDALSSNQALFQQWMTSAVFQQLAVNTNGQDLLLSLPARSIFLFLNYTGQKILKLRSVGLSLEEIKQSYRHLICASDEDDIEQGWRIDTFSLLVLASRLMQESLE